MGFRVRALNPQFVLRLAIFTIALGPCLLSLEKASPASASTTKVSPEFIVKVNAYCSIEEGRFSKTLGKFPFDNFDPTHPDLSTMRKVGRHFAEALPLRRAIPSDLKNLGEPPVGQAQWDALRALAVKSDQVAIIQVQIALTGTTKAFVANVDHTQVLQNKLESTAVKDGFSKKTPCSDVF